MIIRETDQHFIMTTQHEHARFSGEIAKHFVSNMFIDFNFYSDVIVSIQEHDRSWICMDDVPIWNDQVAAPFSFIDYPLSVKLILYRLGIDEVEEMNHYAALLCSLHYASFSHIRRSELMECKDFIRYEENRQKRLQKKTNNQNETLIQRHLKLLQLCDDISLFVCINNPGTTKENIHPWYKDGLEIKIDDQKIIAEWVNDDEILIRPFLFNNMFNVSLNSKHVSKELIKKEGINSAYRSTNWTKLEVIFK